MNKLFIAGACAVLLAGVVLGCGRTGQVDSAEAAAGARAAKGAEVDSLRLPETNYFEIATRFGRMVVRLYDETPLHRDNFKRLVATQYYDSTAFHRVMAGFMIQGGDPNSRDDNPEDDGQGDPGYTLPAEIRPGLIHRRGALAAARQGDYVNPQRRSSGSQFYIVHGTPLNEDILNAMEQQLRQRTGDPSFAFSDSSRAVYGRIGGAPHLDGQYTIFGEVVEGLAVLDSIALVETPRALGQSAPPHLQDRPIEPVRMVVRPLPKYGK